MIKVYEFEGKDLEEARMNCFDTLDVYDNEIITLEEELEDKAKIKTLKIDEVKEEIKNYLTEILNKMNMKENIIVEEDEKIFTVKIKGKASSILIGKEGKNMSALQLLVRQMLRNQTGFNLKINIDVSNYKQRKEHFFERDIKKVINEVLTSKTDTKLDPMNSYNRRLVHSIASNYYNIETESVGEEPNRCVTIKYIEK